MKRQIYVLGNKCPQRITRHRHNDLVSNQRLLRQIELRPVICIIRESQLLCGYVTRCPEGEAAPWDVSVRGNSRWRSRGRPQGSGVEQVDRSSLELVRVSVEMLARMDTWEQSGRVRRATHPWRTFLTISQRDRVGRRGNAQLSVDQVTWLTTPYRNVASSSCLLTHRGRHICTPGQR